VEGHTRLGILMGLIDIDEISAEQAHQVWVGHFEQSKGPDSIK
jgi:hypothetical protein